MEALIKSGCMDDWSDRGVMLSNLEAMLEYNHETNKQNENQISLFGGTLIKAPEFKLQKPKSQPKRKIALGKRIIGTLYFRSSA